MRYAEAMPTMSVAAVPDRAVWLGWALSGLVSLFLVLDSAMKPVPLQPVIDTMGMLGWPVDATLLRTLGLVLIAASILYAFPRTALLGAILITAYLGGAVATHVRIGSPLLTDTLCGVYVGAITLAGLWLRQPRLRALFPVMR